MSIYFVETAVAEQRELLCRWTERFYHGEQAGADRSRFDAGGTAHRPVTVDIFTIKLHPTRDLQPGGAPPAEPVLITVGEFQAGGFDAVICDCPADLEFMSRFETAVHFILRDDAERRQQSRILWQRARDSGINPVHVPYGRQI